MPPISEFFPPHVWVVAFVLVSIAAAGFFIPPSLTEPLGLSFVEHILLVSAAELGAAAGLGALVVHYRDPDASWERDWDHDP